MTTTAAIVGWGVVDVAALALTNVVPVAALGSWLDTRRLARQQESRARPFYLQNMRLRQTRVAWFCGQ
jgi:hypothetical protein